MSVRTTLITATVALMLAAAATADPAKARKKLEKEGLDFTPERFIQRVNAGDAKLVALFLEAGMSPDAADAKGVTALHRAAGDAEGTTLALLLAAGANPNLAAPNGDTPLCKAADAPAPANVKALLAAGADVRAVCTRGRTALHVAAEDGDGEATAALIAAGAQLEARDQHQQTALYFALKAAKTDALRALVAAGADVNVKFKNGRTPLHEATEWDNPAAAEILLGAGAQVEAKDAQGKTPLVLAAAFDRVKMVPVLLAGGADPRQKTREGMTLPELAKRNGSPNVVPLLEGATKVEVAPRPTIAPRGGAVAAGAPASADPRAELAKMGLGFDAKTFFSRVDGGDVRAISLFLAAGIDPASRDEQGRTALWIAVSQKNLDALKALIAGGVKPTGASAPVMEYGKTIVAEAVDGGELAIVRALVEAGADVKTGNDYGMTPLHEAARTGTAELVQLLLKAGADPNAAPSGAHVLFMPVQEDRLEIVELLLRSGSTPGKYKQSLLDAARSPQMKALLQKAR